MSKVLCYSVRLLSLVSISDKAYLATSFNGDEDIIPKSNLAKGIAEKGVTSSRGIKPRVAKGKKEELTEIEEIGEKVVTEAEVLKKRDKKRKNKKGSEEQSKE